jgi:hypothetical protein
LGAAVVAATAATAGGTDVGVVVADIAMCRVTCMATGWRAVCVAEPPHPTRANIRSVLIAVAFCSHRACSNLVKAFAC